MPVFLLQISPSNLIPPFEDLFAEDGILLKAAGLALSSSGSLDVPVAEAEFAEGPDIIAAGPEFTGE